MKKGFILLMMAMACGYVQAQTKISVPQSTATVLIDGKFDPAEWKDAYELKVNDSLLLYFKQDKENMYWCLRGLYRPEDLVVVDFYMTHHGNLLNLHASAKLAERSFTNGSYGDWFWWNNRAWAANITRLDKIEERKFLSDEAKEFQLRKSRFTERSFKLMFEIEYPQRLRMSFPEKALSTQTDHWLTLAL